MHTLNSTCIKKCLPRSTECPVLSLNKCHMSYAMYSNLYPYSTRSIRLTSLSTCLSPLAPLSPSLSLLLLASTLYQYLKCNLSLPFQSEWLLWRLHWKVAGLVKQKLPLKSYFYRSKFNFVSNVFYLINGTKEAKIFSYCTKMARPLSYCVQYCFWSFAIGLPLYQGTINDFIP